MSVADQLIRIKNAKTAIKEAIENKGVVVSDYAKLDEYPALIDSITVGGGESGDGYTNPGFFEFRTQGNTSYKGLFAQISTLDVDLSILDSRNVTDMSYMFTSFGGNTKRITNFQSLDYSKVSTIYSMFYYCYAGGTIDLSGISFPELTTAGRLFYYLYYVTSIDMSNVDMPKVTEVSDMFNLGSGNNVTSINLTGINIPNITSASNLFNYCNRLTSIDVSGFNFSKTTNVNSMFGNCSKLVEIIGEIDASSASNGFLNYALSNPFYSCKLLETVYIKNIYKNVTNMTNASKWSIDLSPTKIKDECLIYIINELPDLINDKGLTATDKIVFTLPTTNTLTAEQVQVALDKGWNVANTTYEVSE